MSLIQRKRSVSVGGQSKIPEGSVSFRALFNTELKQAEGVSVKAPKAFSVVSLDDVAIPYVFKPSKSDKNLITEPLSKEEAPDMHLKAGETYHILSMFNLPAQLKPGEVYRVEGVTQDAYLGAEMSKPSLKLQATRITPCSMTYHQRLEVLRGIPFEDRSVDPARDYPLDGRDAYMDSAKEVGYRFLHIELYPAVSETEGTLFGMVLPPDEEATYCANYTPYDMAKKMKLEPVPALTGGLVQEKVVPAQIGVQQNGGDEKFALTLETMVFMEGGLDRLQLDWAVFGKYVTPFLRGHLMAQINREKTSNKPFDPKDPLLVASCILLPDMKEVAKAMGHKVTWESAKVLGKTLEAPEKLHSAAPPVSLESQTALNLLRYTGDASLMPELEQRGWVEFWVVSNMFIDVEDMERLDEMRGMDQATLLKELTNKRSYVGVTPQYAIFACTTPECPGTIDEFVSARGKPVGLKYLGASSKRVRVEE